MSAIGAIVARADAPVDPSRLEAMRRSLALHGPDTSGVIDAGRAGLAASLMLGFTPHDRFERQPVRGASGLVGVFAGFIANRGEIEDALGMAGTQAERTSDSALALAAWERWDAGALERLDGQFAFALWDGDARTLHAARSILYAPPLHYAQAGDFLALASSPSALHAIGSIPRELDEDHLADILAGHYAAVERSLFKGIRCLPLAHRLTIRHGEVAIARYWHPGDAPAIVHRSARDCAEQAYDLLEAAVAERMRAPATPGIMLSSGLDSTSIAAAASLHARRRSAGAGTIAGYTAVPEPGWDGKGLDRGRAGDESPPLRALAAMYPELGLRTVSAEGLELLEYSDILQRYGETLPRNTSNMAWFVEIAKTAARDGRTVLLSGEMGNADFSLSGAARLPAMLRRGRWLELARELGAIGAGERAFGLFTRAILPLLPERIAHAIIALRGGTAPRWQDVSPVAPGRARDLAIDARRREARRAMVDARSGGVRAVAEAMILDPGRDAGQSVLQAIQSYTRVQVRDPFADRRLVEFCLGLPGSHFLAGGVDRRLARTAMAHRLPGEIFSAARGRQAADWHLKMSRGLARKRAELVRLSGDPQVAALVDCERAIRAIDTWPEHTPGSRDDHPDYRFLNFGLPRAIAAGRFVKWVSGSNS